MTGRAIASKSHIAMQHRFHCPVTAVMRIDGLPPDNHETQRHRYLCSSCGLYLTGTQLTEQERNHAA